MPNLYGNQLLDDDQIYLKLTDTTPLNSSTFTSVAGQSVFAFDYVRGLVDVKLNGKRLKRSEYTATDGVTVTLSTPIPSNSDTLVIYGYMLEGSQNAAGNFLSYGGTANAITLTSNNAQPAKSYKDGAQYKFRATASNTGAATISVDGLPAKACRTITGAALPSGHIRTDMQSVATYYATGDRFVVVSDVGALADTNNAGAVTLATPSQAIAGTPGVIPDAEQVRKNHVAQVATIDDLRALEPAFDGQQFLVAGSGAFEYVLSDTTSTDNGFSVVVSAGGARYKLTEFSGLWLRTKATYGGLAIGPKSFGSPGDDWPYTTGLRDAATVSRDVIGLTDCHAFADKSVIDGVTDAGTYGTFDSTVTLRGSNAQDHVYSFQDRIIYEGSGSVNTLIGLMSLPKHSGTGVITDRYGVDIRDVNLTGAGSVTSQIGVFIRDLTVGSNNVALNIAQSTGNAIYAAGGAPSYHKGDVGIGTLPVSGVKLAVAGDGVVTAKFVVQTNSTSGYCGLQEDVPFYLLQGAGYRLEIADASGAHAVRPGADNSQPLGDASKRWSVVYAGNGAIQTSDEREKEQQRVLTDKEKAAAIELKSAMRAFKWKESVDKKGDDARWHFGVMAQEVERIFERNGLNAHEYGMFCYDEWEAETDDDGNVIKDAGNRYGVRYDQLLAFIVSAL